MPNDQSRPSSPFDGPRWVPPTSPAVPPMPPATPPFPGFRGPPPTPDRGDGPVPSERR